MATEPAPLVVEYTGAVPKGLRSWCDRHADRVQEVVRDEDGLWVYLRSGWMSPDMESHTIHEDTAAECLALLRDVEPCPKD